MKYFGNTELRKKKHKKVGESKKKFIPDGEGDFDIVWYPIIVPWWYSLIYKIIVDNFNIIRYYLR